MPFMENGKRSLDVLQVVCALRQNDICDVEETKYPGTTELEVTILTLGFEATKNYCMNR